jgi:hypothetical protein
MPHAESAMARLIEEHREEIKQLAASRGAGFGVGPNQVPDFTCKYMKKHGSKTLIGCFLRAKSMSKWNRL